MADPFDPSKLVPKFPALSELIPKIPATKLTIPAFENLENGFTNPLVESVEANYASEFHKRLTQWIQLFDSQLDETHEVGVRLVSFGQTVVFHLKHIGFWNPSLISFQGVTTNGEPVELIQHVSQISILLMKLPRLNPSEPKRPIGFRLEGEATE